ncbi:MAG: nucleotide-binding protein [Treponemataceae bacterium]|nr:nucleotide-binding protein [Treponemataceae bacterium]
MSNKGCYFCNSSATVEKFSSEIVLYKCPLCGKYFIDTFKVYELPISKWRKNLTSFLFYNKLPKNTYYFIGEEKNAEVFEKLESESYKIVKVSDELLKDYMNLSFSEQMDKFLVYLADKCERAGIGKDFYVREIYSAAFVQYYDKNGNDYSNDEQSRQYSSIKDYLEKQKQYVKFTHSFSYEKENKINLSLTPTAFEYLDELKKNEAKTISMNSNNMQSSKNKKIDKNKVFIVYGHDEDLCSKVEKFIETLGLTPVILSDKPNQGMTIIEKLHANSDVGFAIVLYTPDDSVKNGDETYKQPRPNVIFEYGYFMGLLGREKIALFVKGEVEGHTDIDGTGYIKVLDDDGWKLKLIQELQAASYDIDLNKLKNA